MLAILASVAALSLSSSAYAISGNCTSTLTALVTSSDGSCLNLGGALTIATATGSIVGPVDTYVRGLCQASPCSNSTLQSIGNRVASGCNEDLLSFGIPQDIISNLGLLAQKYYPYALTAACTQSSSNNSLCVTNDLRTIQTARGRDLTTSNIFDEFTGYFESGQDAIRAVTCTDCTRSQYAAIRPALDGSFGEFENIGRQYADSYLNSTCGASFVNGGATPSGIIVATGSLSTQTPTNTPGSAAQLMSLSSAATGGNALLGVLVMVFAGAGLVA